MSCWVKSSDRQEQIQFDGITIEHCHSGFKSLRQRKKSTSFTKIIQGSGEAFTDLFMYLFIFTKISLSCEQSHISLLSKTGVDRGLGYENSNTKLKKLLDH